MGIRSRRAQRIERAALELRDAVEARLAEVVAGRTDSTATVARLPTTIAARALIADAAGMCPLLAVRDGAVVEPTPSVLVRPDPGAGMTRRRWVHRAAMSLSGAGGLWVRTLRLGSNDWPLSVEVLPPGVCSPRIDLVCPWRVEGWDVSGVPAEPGEVTYVPLWEPDLDQPVARSPLAEAQAAMDDLAFMWAFASGYWREGGKPPYALTYPSRLTNQQATEALDAWIAARQTHRPGIVTGGWDIKDLSMPTAADSLLLDGLAYIDQVIGRLYGVTPTLLNLRAETGSLTYSNAQDEVSRWLSLSLYPTWLARIEDAMGQQLPHGQQAVFDIRGLVDLGMTRPALDEGRGAGAGPPAPAPAPEPDPVEAAADA